jgi:hypothetical protein
MLFLIGLDDTDNNATENTCSLAERMGVKLQENRLCRLVSITSHQLLLDPSITYTSANQSVCLLVDADHNARRDLELACREFLLRECEPGSNAGFCLSTWSGVSPAIVAWGEQAKTALLTRREAISLARESSIAIAGFTGNGIGVIGALAAVGLYFSGNDGRFLWLPGLRNLHGIHKFIDLLNICSIGRVENMRGRRPLPNDRINVSDGAYPILRDGKSLLLVEPAKKDEPYEWLAISEKKAIQLSQ